MTAPDLFAKPEPQKARVYGVFACLFAACSIQPVGEPGGATNASPGSNHTLRKGRERNG